MRACRIDKNQPEIVECFRTLGFSVLHIHTLKNCADLIISRAGRTAVIEIKDGSKPKSAQKLTTGELKFKNEWQGEYHIVTSVEEAIDISLEWKKRIYVC